MFYSKELLSLKSKTELSVLYYISTYKGQRKITKEQILNLEIKDLIDKIECTEIPFALRLYSYFIVGLNRLYLLKLNLLTKTEKVRKKVNTVKKTKLERVEQILTLEESSSISDRFRNNSLSFENADFTSFVNENVEFPINKDIHDPVIEDNNLFIKKYKEVPKFVIPGYEIFTIHKKILELKPEITDINEINNFNEINDYNEISNFDNLTVEDARISSSVSSQNKLEDYTNAEWFYNLLVRASKNEIIVSQLVCYGEIFISEIN